MKEAASPQRIDDPSEEGSGVSPRVIRLGDAACSMKQGF